MGFFSDILEGITGGAGAAREAGQAQVGATSEAIAEQRRQFDITQGGLAPFLEAGQQAVPRLTGLLGFGTPEEQAAATRDFEESAGQRFLREQQERALLRNQAAIGGLGGGRVRQELQEQAFGRAATQRQQEIQNLFQLTGVGQQTAVQQGQFGANAATNIGGLLTQRGEAQAGSILGQQQARAGLSENVINVAALAAGL